MKIAIVYFWTIVLLPFLFFVKGDLNLDTMTEFGGYNYIEQIKESIDLNFGKTKPTFLTLKVKVNTENKNFTGDGIAVYLLNKEYKELAKSQIINGHVSFSFNATNLTDNNLVAMCKLTNDEVKFTLNYPEELVINN